MAGAALGSDEIEQRNDAIDALRNNPLRIGISTRALFDLEEEHRVFDEQGVKAYATMQLQRESAILGKGAGFEVVERLLQLNVPDGLPYVEVVLLSQNSPDLSLRAFRAVEYYGLTLKTGGFTSGRSLAPFVPAWGIDLFLSNADADVRGAVTGGAAAARLGMAPKERGETPAGEVRVAFDGDAVVFGAESDAIYNEQGIDAFPLRTPKIDPVNARRARADEGPNPAACRVNLVDSLGSVVRSAPNR